MEIDDILKELDTIFREILKNVPMKPMTGPRQGNNRQGRRRLGFPNEHETDHCY